MVIREMTMEDYEQVYCLWKKIRGFGIRSIDDSREGVKRFLKRNPTTSVVAEEDGRIVGSILCGHDGRRGCLYHVCVDEEHRRRAHRKSHGGKSHGGSESRGDQQGLPHRFHEERHRQCVLEHHRLDGAGGPELL